MASKPIKVDESVYAELDELRRKGETFDDVVADLLGARKVLLEAISMLEGQLRLYEWKLKRLQEMPPIG